jgi:APA family basic amino acid/polyamine antiporter
MGEIVAWIIGWALILEYALGAATVSIAWSEYFNRLLGGAIPYEWTHSPFQSAYDSAGVLHNGIFNAPALLIVLISFLIKGTQQWENTVIVFIKLSYRYLLDQL